MTLICPDSFNRYKALVAWSLLVASLEAIPYIFPSLIQILPAFPGNAFITLFVLASIFLFQEIRMPIIWWLLISIITTAVVIISAASPQMSLTILINAAIEEIIFRLAIPVVLYVAVSRMMNTQLSLWIAIVISSGLFALAHSETNLSTLILGFLWCLIVWRGQSLISAIISHTLMNFTILAHQTSAISQPGYSILILMILWTSVLPIHYNQAEKNNALQRQ